MLISNVNHIYCQHHYHYHHCHNDNHNSISIAINNIIIIIVNIVIVAIIVVRTNIAITIAISTTKQTLLVLKAAHSKATFLSALITYPAIKPLKVIINLNKKLQRTLSLTNNLKTESFA